MQIDRLASAAQGAHEGRGGIKDFGCDHEGGIEGMEAYGVRKFISQA
jgi:hypothetical protein